MTRIKTKFLRPVSYEDFEVIQLDENPMSLVRIGVSLLSELEEGLIKCLRDNVDIFPISIH